MTLKEWRKEEYNYFTGKASDIARHLCFVGIALIWLLKPVDGELSLTYRSYYALLFCVIALMLDFFQYTWGSFIWGLWTRIIENNLKKKLELDPNTNQNPEIEAPNWFNWPTNTFFWLKLVSVIFGYHHILKRVLYLLKRI